MRILRYFAIAAVVLLLAGAGAVYWLLSSDAVRTTLERQAAAWLGQQVVIRDVSVRFFPQLAVSLADVQVGQPAALSFGDVRVTTDLRALFSRRIENAELLVTDGSVRLPLPFVLPTVSAPQSASAGAAALTVASIGRINLDNVSITSRGRGMTVNARSSFVSERLVISSLSARSGATFVEASGVVELEPRVSAKLEMKAPDLDLDDLMALAAAFSLGSSADTSKTPASQAKLVAKISADRARAAGVQVERFTTDLLAEGERIDVSPLRFSIFGGRFDGAIDVELGAQMLDVDLRVGIEKLDVAQLAAFGGAPGTITGTLSGSGHFGGRGRDLAAVLASARGNGKAAISSGTVRGLQIVPAVVRFFGRRTEQRDPPAGERFDLISGDFGLRRQTVESTSLTLQSPDLDVIAQGTFAIPDKAIDLRGDLVLSEGLSKEAGNDLYRYAREGSRIVLPATISGTLEQPRVRIDAGAAVRRGIRNEVQERLKGLFKRGNPTP